MDGLNKQQSILLAACELSEKIKEVLSRRGLSGSDAESVIQALLISLPSNTPFAMDGVPPAISEPQPY